MAPRARPVVPAVASSAAQSKLDLAVDELPLLARPQQGEELVEGGRVLGRELEPGEEVERLAEVVGVMQPSRDAGEVREAIADVALAIDAIGASRAAHEGRPSRTRSGHAGLPTLQAGGAIALRDRAATPCQRERPAGDQELASPHDRLLAQVGATDSLTARRPS
jgi:hypothetical protein